jgi:uncharacterized membrane protein YkvA (DUF1232 family)
MRVKEWARRMTLDVHALYLAARDPRVPWLAKAVAFGVAAYALSPIDLIPDFIPVIGYLDDLIIVPLGIAVAIRLVPPPLMAEFRAAARPAVDASGLGKWGAVIVAVIWIAVVAAVMLWLSRVAIS